VSDLEIGVMELGEMKKVALELQELRADNAALRAMLAKHTWTDYGMGIPDEAHDSNIGYLARCVECGARRQIFYDKKDAPEVHLPDCGISKLLETRP
jgi:hypothetical protein